MGKVVIPESLVEYHTPFYIGDLLHEMVGTIVVSASTSSKPSMSAPPISKERLEYTFCLSLVHGEQTPHISLP